MELSFFDHLGRPGTTFRVNEVAYPPPLKHWYNKRHPHDVLPRMMYAERIQVLISFLEIVPETV